MNVWQILDNKNLTGDTLAARRLRIKEDKYNLSDAIFTFSQLLKYYKPGAKYIDHLGYIFTYRKTKKANLIYREILHVDYIIGRGLLLTVEGVSMPIAIPASSNIEGYVGLLEYNGGYLLYDMPSKVKKKDTWRKI